MLFQATAENGSKITCYIPKYDYSRSFIPYPISFQATAENGSKITSYILEYDQGRGDGRFTEVHSGLQKQYKVTKLTASTRYVFRLAAVNSVGKR